MFYKRVENKIIDFRTETTVAEFANEQLAIDYIISKMPEKNKRPIMTWFIDHWLIWNWKKDVWEDLSKDFNYPCGT